MTIKQIISVLAAVTSAWLGGNLGAAALEKANAAPLASDAWSMTTTPAAPARLPRL